MKLYIQKTYKQILFLLVGMGGIFSVLTLIKIFRVIGNFDDQYNEYIKSTINAWQFPFFFPEKLFTLITYIVFFSFIGLWGLIYLFIFIKKKWTTEIIPTKNSHKKIYIGTCILISFLPIISYFFPIPCLPLISSALCFFFICTLAAYICSQKISHPIFLTISVIVLFLHLAILFLFLFANKPFVLNSWYSIPEKTIIKKHDGTTRTVDNITYLREHNLAGVTPYDLRVDNGRNPSLQKAPWVKIPYSPLLESSIKYVNHTLGINNLHGGNLLDKSLTGPPFLLYNPNLQALISTQAPSQIPLQYQQLIINSVEKKHQQKLKYFFSSDSTAPKPLNQEQTYFTHVNSHEFHWQVLDRYTFHHHNFLLGSANEYLSGRPVKEINMQYGYFNTIITAKILNFLGELNYFKYMKFLYSSYFIYLIIAIICIWRIAHSKSLCLTYAFCYIIYIELFNYEVFALAPGYSPNRHFLDILCLTSGYYYIKNSSWKKFILLLLLTCMGILIDCNFGTGLAIALLCCMTGELFFNKTTKFSFKLLSQIILLGIFSIICCLWARSLNQDHLTPFYLGGLVALPVTPIIYFGGIGFIVASVILLLLFWNKISISKRFLIGSTTIYTSIFFLYYVWSSNLWHALYTCPLYLFLLSIWLQKLFIFIDKYIPKNSIKINPNFDFYLLSLIIPFSVVSLFFYLFTYYTQVYSITSTHVIQEWKNPRVPIITTAEEECFDQAVGLINKYIPDEEKGIYIYSRMDNIIPFLAGKYSAMKYPDLEHFLVTPENNQELTKHFLSKMPQYLFTDTDILRNFEYDLPPVIFPSTLKREAMLRYCRINNIKNCFKEILPLYTLKEQTPLISVWERKTSVQ